MRRIGMAVAICIVGCNGKATSTSDSFANGGGPAPQTVSVSSSDGVHYQGQAGVSAYDTPAGSRVLMMINATEIKGSRQWSAQLSLSPADLAKGSVSLQLKPGSQEPNTGFIDDQGGTTPLMSQGGTAKIDFQHGYQFTGTVNADTPALSGSFGGKYTFQCFIPASGSSTGSADGGASPGTPSSGSAVEQDVGLSSTFCQQFAGLR